jgi:hypothetical protein
MILACLQPCFAPNLYYLAALQKADCIIFQSNAIWSRKGRSHRFQIRTAEGPMWLNIPILTEDKKKPISEVRIDHHSDSQWLVKWEKTFDAAYKNSIYYEHFELELKADFEQLREMNLLYPAIQFMNARLFSYLEFQISESAIDCGKTYLDLYNPNEILELSGAKLIYQEQEGKVFQWIHERASNPLPEHPIYRQHFGGFIPNLSVFDLLFEVGPEAYHIFDRF